MACQSDRLKNLERAVSIAEPYASRPFRFCELCHF
jgi:hypothetical protein